MPLIRPYTVSHDRKSGNKVLIAIENVWIIVRTIIDVTNATSPMVPNRHTWNMKTKSMPVWHMVIIMS